MVQEIEEILSKPVKEVISSPLSLTLLKIYSTLYLGGYQPRWCERSQTSYYNQLAIDGLKKAKEMKEIIERTCQLKPDLLIYVASLATHITHANITDWLACEGLTKGFLKESQFIKLPDCWLNKDEVKEPIKNEVSETQHISAKIETRGRKSKHNR